MTGEEQVVDKKTETVDALTREIPGKGEVRIEVRREDTLRSLTGRPGDFTPDDLVFALKHARREGVKRLGAALLKARTRL